MAGAQRGTVALNYKCQRCGRGFPSGRELGGHLNKGTICAAVITTAETFAAAAAIMPTSSDSPSDSSESHTVQESTASSDEQDRSADEPVDLPGDEAADNEPADIPFVHLYQLLQRPGVHEAEAKHRIADTILRPGSRARACNPRNTLKLDVVRLPEYVLRVFTYDKTARIQ